MPKLFNKESGEEEIVGFDKVNEAVLSGKYRFGSAQVPLLHPHGDEIYLFPAEKAEEIMRDNNYRFPDKKQTTSFYERLDADIASAEKEEDLEEKYGDRGFSATGLGLLRGASIGLSDPALIKSGLFSQEELREIDERNEAASTISEIAGAVAPALIPGYGAATLSGLAARGSAAIGRRLAGEAAKKSLVRVASSYGVVGAIEGGAYGIGQTISEEALGRGEATAEAYVANIKMGAALGLGGGFFLGGSANMMGRIARSVQAAKKFKKDALIKAKNDGLNVDINDTRRLEEIFDSDTFIKYAPRDKNGKIKSGGFGRNIKDKIAGVAEFATGADKKLLDEFFSVSPHGAKLRANATMSQAEKFKMTDDYVNEMVKKYNLNEDLIKIMTGGEKYIMMRKALKEVDQEVALDAVADYITRSKIVLDDMKARPTEYSKELYIPKVQRAIEQLEADISSATSAFQIFKILDEAKKKTIDKWMRYGKNLTPIEEETIRHLREKVRNPLKNLLESEDVFGKAGTMQKKINKTAFSYYDFVDNFNKNFSEKVTVGGEKVPKISAQKITNYLQLRGRYHATASQRKLSGPGGQNELFQQQKTITGLAQDLASDSPEMTRTLSGMDVGDQQIMDDVVTIFTQHNQKRQSAWDDLVMGKERMAVTDEMKKIRESIDASAEKLEDIEKAMSAEHKLKDLTSDGIKGTGFAVNMIQKLDQVIRYTRDKINKQMQSFVKPAGNAASGVFRGTAVTDEMTGRPVKSEKKEKEDFKKKKDEISRLVADPTMMVVRLSENLGELPDAAPNTSFHIGQALNRAIQYASSKIPRSPMEGMWMTAEQPEPSNDQMATFRNVMRAIEDPLVLGDQLANGLIIPETLDTVKNVYPFIFEQMKSELLKQVTSSPVPINFHQQALVSKFVGASSPMTRQTAGLQSTWTGMASQPIKKKTNKLQNLDTLMKTPLQRVNVV